MTGNMITVPDELDSIEDERIPTPEDRGHIKMASQISKPETQLTPSLANETGKSAEIQPLLREINRQEEARVQSDYVEQIFKTMPDIRPTVSFAE